MADRGSSFDMVATMVIAGCALVMTGVYVWKETKSQPDPSAPVYIDNWERYVAGDMRIGTESGQVVVIEFSDFQCPFCAQLARVLKEVSSRHPDEFHIVYRNFPLDQIHPYARPAALAAHCAARAGRFEAFHDYLFAHADSIGRESWGVIAHKVEVADTSGFLSCMTSHEAAESLSADSVAAESLDIRGSTPMLLVNGWRYRGVPSIATLDSIVTSVIGRSQ